MAAAVWATRRAAVCLARGSAAFHPRRRMSYPTYQVLQVTRPVDHVVHVELNRPDKSNAMDGAFIREFGDCFTKIAGDKECRAVVLTGSGKNFCGGLDLSYAAELFMNIPGSDPARKAKFLYDFTKGFQEALTSVERCPQPVIAAVHSACVGGGVDLIAACDIRYCTADSWYQIKEVGIGLAADIGTLQRLPKIVGNHSLVRELAYTARKFTSDEAAGMGLMSRVLPDKTAAVDAAMSLASDIATKSPVAVFGTKRNLNYSRDHSVEEGLEYAATWNMAMVQTEDVMSSVQAVLTKTEPTFSKL